MEIEPALTNIEVVEKTFSAQYRRHVVSYGGGIRAKDLRDSSSKAKLQAKLKKRIRMLKVTQILWKINLNAQGYDSFSII